MRKFIMCVFIIIVTSNLYSQNSDSISFKTYIKKSTKDSTSRFYYPKLLNKVKTSPSEITVEDCYYLYYGQMLEKNFIPIDDLFFKISNGFNTTEIKSDCRKTLKSESMILGDNPINLPLLLHISFCMQEVGYVDTTYYYEQRFKNLLRAINLTGDGHSKETAIKIVHVTDDHILSRIMGFNNAKEYITAVGEHAYSVWKQENRELYFEDIYIAKE